MYSSIDKANIGDVNEILASTAMVERLSSPNDYEDIMNGLYSVKQLPYNLVPYRTEGLYDKIAKSMKEHRNELEMPDQDRYDWFQINFSWKLAFQVCLMKPGFDRVSIKVFSKDGETFYKHVNYVKLNMKWYYSTKEKCNAVTFADSTNIIKPMKILAHDWEDYGNVDMPEGYEYLMNVKPIYHSRYDSPERNKICKKCGLLGSSYYGRDMAGNPSLKYVIMPEKLLTCTEYTIDDILT